MIIITGVIKVESEDELNRVKSALVRRAERSRADRGNLQYVFSQNIEDPTEVILTEKWEDEASLQAHLAVPDEEFSKVISSALIQSAVVVSGEVASERVLLER